MKPLRSASSRLVWETETVHRNRVAQVNQIDASLSILLAPIKKDARLSAIPQSAHATLLVIMTDWPLFANTSL